MIRSKKMIKKNAVVLSRFYVVLFVAMGLATQQEVSANFFNQYAYLDNETDATDQAQSPYELSDANDALDFSESEKWTFRLTPYFWLSAMDVDTTVAGATAEVDLSFKDIMDHFDVVGASTHFEAWKNDEWGIMFGFSWILMEGDFEIEDPGTFPIPINFEVEVDIEQTIVALAVVKKVEHENISKNPELPRYRDVDIYGGLQYQYLRQEITITPGPGKLGKSKEWLEPLIGARLSVGLSEKVSFTTMGDLAGFGIGSASDLTAKCMAGFNYKTAKSSILRLSYRLMYIDYSNGSGSEEFGIKGLFHGPWVGWTFLF